MVIKVDNDKCTHCGLCVKVCMTSSIALNEDNIPSYTKEGIFRCNGCQHCMAICPTGSISLNGLDPNKSEPVGYGNSDSILNLIKSRRSIRFFKDESLSKDNIEKIKEMLAYTPKGDNVESLLFSIVGTKEKMESIRQATYNNIMKMPDDLSLIKFIKWSYQNGKDIVYRNSPSMVAAFVNSAKVIPGCEAADPIIALSYLELYAWSLGLATCWCDIGWTMIKQMPDVCKLIEMPDGYDLGYIMLIGVPTVKYRRTVQKEPTNAKVI